MLGLLVGMSLLFPLSMLVRGVVEVRLSNTLCTPPPPPPDVSCQLAAFSLFERIHHQSY